MEKYLCVSFLVYVRKAESHLLHTCTVVSHMTHMVSVMVSHIEWLTCHGQCCGSALLNERYWIRDNHLFPEFLF